MEDMKNIVEGKTYNAPKYRYYSAHDNNIANHLAAYAPSFNFTGIPFASSIYFELYNIFGLWYVQASYNGQQITLGGCNDHELCQWEPFMRHMDTYLYQGDLTAACTANYTMSGAEEDGSVELKFLQ